MKLLIRKVIESAILAKNGEDLSGLSALSFNIETPKGKEQGDFSTNIALLGAKEFGVPPKELAKKLLPILSESNLFESIDIAGPGFINFTVAGPSLYSVIKTIQVEGDSFGSNNYGNGKKIHIEFVSANPTGPLHVGHGRGAAVGSALARIYHFCGYDVCCEYYVNDAGRQMDILTLSVYQRYVDKYLGSVGFSDNTYVGEYVTEIADAIHQSNELSLISSQSFRHSSTVDLDVEKSLDRGIKELKSFLGDEKFSAIRRFSCAFILKNIKTTLAKFCVEFDSWFSEEHLVREGQVEAGLKKLDKAGQIYRNDGAVWFSSSNLGDEKDRVVIREDGRYTYFATDIGYHLRKIEKGFHRLINIWGADHHGYIPRLRAALEVLGFATQSLEFILVQFASLVQDGRKVSMSTRKGSFITLESLMDDVGVDASRFFYLIRKADQHMDFDLNLAKEKNSKNPVYYIQYAHARISSVLDQATESGWKHKIAPRSFEENLSSEPEREQVLFLSVFPDVVSQSGVTGEPNLIAQYLKDLAYLVHSNYASNKILVEDLDLREGRLQLARSTKQVLENGLRLLAITRPDKM